MTCVTIGLAQLGNDIVLPQPGLAMTLHQHITVGLWPYSTVSLAHGGT